MRVDTSRSSGGNGVVADSARQQLLWVEDESELRQVARVNQDDVVQWEMLFDHDGQQLSKSSATGAILGNYQSNLAAKWELMRDMSVQAGAEGHQLRSLIGPVAVVSEHISVDAIVLNYHMGVTLAAGGIVDRCMSLGCGAGRRDISGANIVAKAYNAVLQAASRVRKVMFDRDRPRTRAIITDSVKTLDALTREASGWLESAISLTGLQQRQNSWRDMAWEKVRGQGIEDLAVGRTLVRQKTASVEVVSLEARQGASNVPGVYREMSMVNLRREDLHGAEMGVMEQGGRPYLKVVMRSAVMKTWLTVPPAGNGLALDVIGDSAVRAHAVKQLIIECDSQDNAAELAAVLRTISNSDVLNHDPGSGR